MKPLELHHLVRAVDEHQASLRGMALHYLTLHALLVGMEAKTTMEFGAGASTSIFLLAHLVTGGHHVSISTESRENVDEGRSVVAANAARWTHWQGLSSEVLPTFLGSDWFDLVLHDGSHSADVVEADLRAMMPHMVQYGLVLVHDTQHSYVGSAMRDAVGRILRDFDVSHVTLPFGFGLTILRNEAPTTYPPVPLWHKKGSLHRTFLCRVGRWGG